MVAIAATNHESGEYTDDEEQSTKFPYNSASARVGQMRGLADSNRSVGEGSRSPGETEPVVGELLAVQHRARTGVAHHSGGTVDASDCDRRAACCRWGSAHFQPSFSL